MADHNIVQYSPAYLAEDRRPALLSVAVAFLVLGTVAVILRFVSRRIGRVGWHHDDIFIVAGWIFYVAFIAVAIGDVHYGGVGLHQVRVMAIDPVMLTNWAKFLLAIAFIYIFAVILPKLAVLSLYISIFSRHRLSRLTCYITGALMIGNCIGCAAAGFAVCTPLRKLWEPSVQGHCLNINAWFRYSRIVNIASDVVMLVLPIPHVVRLQSTIRLKVGLLITFLLGSVGLIAGLIALFAVSTTNAVSDNTWSAALLLIWTMVELGMYLVASCLISYQPLAKLIWRNTWRRWRGQKDSSLDQEDSHIRVHTNSTLASQTHGRVKGDDAYLELVTTRDRHNRHWSAGGIMVERQVMID
ncbi:uncharacterized protein ACLA_025390 [Aspergillus clavatus NRRL 1]|uniref:Integral membrane protein n=1 Tax=Aspergillus clavatus (strain ATCC 1007 / CBS 513.65 / DSM 816 / NCTC 3887 / NRRL 1 / QM 1276 / 107) TaxID=344612 RepID=A1CQA1_ASPCL|nr:uncharacterized protein ACLA_025390 [Aspergillus clavatus NRRL 1]EAW07822.1 integral membrane protein [Aspergillus clavatus NRRL 1]